MAVEQAQGRSIRPESDRAVSARDLDFDHTLVERALGVQWHVNSDTFGFKIATKDKPPTRRGILSVISSIYDPLSFVAPFHLSAKILLQNLCRKQLGWDDLIPEDDLIRWKNWLEELPRLEQFSISRCFKPPNFGDIISCQLHHFSDASQVAYGAVSYLRLVSARHKVLLLIRHGEIPLITFKASDHPKDGTICHYTFHKAGQNDMPRARTIHQQLLLLDGQHLCAALHC